MSLQFADRIKETTASTGTGSIALDGAAIGYRTFISSMSVGDTCFYCIDGKSTGEWETGLGTLSSSNVLARTSILASSNSNAAVSFSSGPKEVFMTYPAYAVQRSQSYPLYQSIVEAAGVAALNLNVSGSLMGAFRALIRFVQTQDNVSCNLRINNSTTGSHYASIHTAMTGSTTWSVAANPYTAIRLFEIGSGVSELISGVADLTFFCYNNEVQVKGMWFHDDGSSGFKRIHMIAGRFTGGTDVTSLNLVPSAGDLGIGSYIKVFPL
jgi:hypothetical protein